MNGEGLFSVRGRKAAARELFYVLGVVIVGLIITVVVVWTGVFKEGVTTEDAMVSAAKDISTYVTSMSAVDGGLQLYTLPKETGIVVKSNSMQLILGDIKVTAEFSADVKENRFSAKEICIVKNMVNGQGEISICDVGDFKCCQPIIE